MPKTDLQQQAAQTILTTRDFCGNEEEAVRELCADEGAQFTQSFFTGALAIANNNWRQSQKAAGVKPKYYRY